MGSVIDRQQQRMITLSREITLFSKGESSSRGKVPSTAQGRKSKEDRSREEPSGELREGRIRLMRRVAVCGVDWVSGR